jgi:hypothetical protein
VTVSATVTVILTLNALEEKRSTVKGLAPSSLILTRTRRAFQTKKDILACKTDFFNFLYEFAKIIVRRLQTVQLIFLFSKSSMTKVD